jgi:Zn-dependent peptidase ImmA (M78 family)
MSAEVPVTFGDRAIVALEFRRLADPDQEKSAPFESVGSWGEWALWIAGENLCGYEHPELSDQATGVVWYMAPLFRFLIENWDPLLHEERLPLIGRSAPSGRMLSARDAYLRAVALYQGENRIHPWYAWAGRHALRRYAEGGIVPDLFIRRLGDDLEISWGHRTQPGADGVYFVAEPGRSQIPVESAVEAFNQAIGWFLDQSDWYDYAWFQLLAEKARRRTESSRQQYRLCWYLDSQEHQGSNTAHFQEAIALTELPAPLYMSRQSASAILDLSPAVAMFGALSPAMSAAASARLLAHVMVSQEAGTANSVSEPRPVEKFVDDDPAWMAASPWNAGYELARTILDDLEVINEMSDFVDIEKIIRALGIHIVSDDLDPDGPRGVAIAGETVAPAIIVNAAHSRNQRDEGRRFTLGHELCHILFDRGRARQLTHASTPWAPLAVEQRANAFAAMILMPQELVERVFVRQRSRAELKGILNAASRLKVGWRAAIQHFANIGVIDDDEREDLEEEAGATA